MWNSWRGGSPIWLAAVVDSKRACIEGDVFDGGKALYTVVELMTKGSYGAFIQAASTAMIGEIQMAPFNQERIANQLSELLPQWLEGLHRHKRPRR